MQDEEENLYLDGPIVRTPPPERAAGRSPSPALILDAKTSTTSARDGAFNNSEAKDRAAETRKMRAESRRKESVQKVFAVRLPPPSVGYGWEIRRFGSFVLSQSEIEFRTSAEAVEAGEAALALGAAQR